MKKIISILLLTLISAAAVAGIAQPGPQGMLIKFTKVYVSNSTWTADPRTKRLFVEGYGGGSGAGGCHDTNGCISGAGHAGTRDYTYSTYNVGGNYNIVIGFGGAGGLAGQNNGSNGGTTSMYGTGIILSAVGGLYGIASHLSWLINQVPPSGESAVGQGGGGGYGGTGGAAGANSAAGGGACHSYGAGACAGGAGGSGVLFIWEYQ